MITDAATAICPTCKTPRRPEEFYASSVECKPCKRDRSSMNRATAAMKVALADRFLDLLERLVDQGWQPDGLAIENTETKAAPSGALTPAGSLDRQTGATQ